MTRTAVMPLWYTTAQWRNQVPKNTYIDTHQKLKSIKAISTPHDELHYCPNWVGPQTKGPPKKDIAGRVLLTKSSNKQKRSVRQLNPPKHHWRRELIWKVRT